MTKVSSKDQITSATLAFKHIEDAFAGEAEKAGFKTEEDMQKYIKELRKSKRDKEALIQKQKASKQMMYMWLIRKRKKSNTDT